jgi:hypothetical protein
LHLLPDKKMTPPAAVTYRSQAKDNFFFFYTVKRLKQTIFT